MSEISEIPFLDNSKLNGARFVPTIMFYDGKWHIFIPIKENKFVKIDGVPAEAVYFGTHAERSEDFSSPFLDFISQRANMRSIMRQYNAITDDIFNLAASIKKISILHSTKSDGASRMAATEVEYICILCRGLFDHLQEIIAEIWRTVHLFDGAVKKRLLKKSFADVALAANQPRSSEEVVEKYGLPIEIAQCYERHSAVFLKLRQFRDEIIHGGRSVQMIFSGDFGFQIQRDFGPFQDIKIWRDEELETNDLAPLLPAIGLLVRGTFVACNDFALEFQRVIKFDDPIAPSMDLYVRGYFNSDLVQLLQDSDARVAEGRSLIG